GTGAEAGGAVGQDGSDPRGAGAWFMSAASVATHGRRALAQPQWLAVVLLAVAAVGSFGPLAPAGVEGPVTGVAGGGAWLLLALAGAAAAALLGGAWGLAGATVLSIVASFLVIMAQRALPGEGGWGYWLTLAGSLAAAAVATGAISLMGTGDTDAGGDARAGAPTLGWGALPFLQRVLPAATVPFLLLLGWEGLVVGFRVPAGIFPTVSSIGAALMRSWPVLMADAYLTFVREVLFGFLVGLAAGFLAGTAIAFSGFLRRGFLPLATAFGAVPIVGLAPVLGRALGVDWESKAAVVVIVTFFPVVLNTVQGLTSVDPLK